MPYYGIFLIREKPALRAGFINHLGVAVAKLLARGVTLLNPRGSLHRDMSVSWNIHVCVALGSGFRVVTNHLISWSCRW